MSHSPPRRRGLVGLFLIVTLLITVTAIAQVRAHLRAIELGYQIVRARKAQQKLRERNRRLHIELALLKNPDRVARIARQELGLTEPEPEQIHRLRAIMRSPASDPSRAPTPKLVRQPPSQTSNPKALAARSATDLIDEGASR